MRNYYENQIISKLSYQNYFVNNYINSLMKLKNGFLFLILFYFIILFLYFINSKLNIKKHKKKENNNSGNY